MRSRVIGKWRSLIEVIAEKIREWLNKLIDKSIPTKPQRSNLVEEYIIYEKFSGETVIRDFINERTRSAMLNRYGIGIKTVDDIEEQRDSDMEEIGKVRLMRKRTLIDEATLVIKKEERNIVYWKFNK